MTDTDSDSYELPLINGEIGNKEENKTIPSNLTDLYRKHFNVTPPPDRTENKIGCTRLITVESTRFKEESHSIRNKIKMVAVNLVSFMRRAAPSESVKEDTRNMGDAFLYQEVKRQQIITQKHLELDIKSDEEAQMIVDIKKNVARKQEQPNEAKRQEDEEVEAENLNSEVRGCRWPKRRRDLRTPGDNGSYKFANNAKLQTVKLGSRAPKKQRKQSSVDKQSCRWPKRQRKQRDLRTPGVAIYVNVNYKCANVAKQQTVKSGRRVRKQQRKQPMQSGKVEMSSDLEGRRWPKRQRKQRDLKIPDVTIYVDDDYKFAEGEEEEELQKFINGTHVHKRQREQPSDDDDGAKLQETESTRHKQLKLKQNTIKQSGNVSELVTKTFQNRYSTQEPLVLPFTLLSGSWA